MLKYTVRCLISARNFWQFAMNSKENDGYYNMALTGNSLCQFDLPYWTGGPRTLHELLRLSGDSELDEELLKLVPEYPLHLINLASLEHTEYFRTELRLLMELYKLKDDGERWQEYIDSSTECQCMDEDTYKLLEVLAHVEGLDVEKNKREDKVNMCKAIEEIKEKAREEGKEEERVRITCEYVREGLLKIADAAKKLNMPQEELELLLNNM